MRSRKMRRMAGSVVVAVVAMSVVSAVSLGIVCSHNATNRSAWTAYKNSWHAEAGDHLQSLRSFADTSVAIKSHLGETRSPCGFCSQDGKVVIEANYIACAPEFVEGMAWARRPDGIWVVLRPDGGVVFELEAVGIWSFASGLARVRIREPDGWTADGFVDMNGQVVIPATFASAEDFVGEYTLVHERTFVTELMRGIVRRTGISAESCFAYRVRILNRHGAVVQPSRLRSPAMRTQ